MPVTTRTSRGGQFGSLTFPSTKPTPAPDQTKTRRAIKEEMRKLREQLRTAVDDDESDDAEDTIVVGGQTADSESESKSESEPETYVPPKRQTKKKQPQPSKPRALPTRARPVPKAAPGPIGPVLVTVPLTKDPRVTDIPLNDMLPFVNRSASVRQEEQIAKPETAGKSLNPFFVYKMAYHARIKHIQYLLGIGLVKKDRAQVNYQKIASQSWKLENQSVREYYTQLSQIDEKNRANASKDCPELFKRAGPGVIRGEKKLGRPFGAKDWAKPRPVLKSDMQKVLPVGVTPAVAVPVAAEPDTVPVDLDLDIVNNIDLADLLSPSAVLPAIPTTPTRLEHVPVVPLDPTFVKSFTGFYDHSEMQSVSERFAQLPRRATYIDSTQITAEEPTIPVEEMCHLALDDHERDASEEETPVAPIQPEYTYPSLESVVGFVGFTEQLDGVDIDFSEAMANYEAMLGETQH